MSFIVSKNCFSQDSILDTEIRNKAHEYLSTLTGLDKFSGSVLLVREGKIILNKGYAFANRGKGIMNKADTRFRIASVTKQFTATAILMLEEQKKLSTPEFACKYLSECPEIWKNITIHHLLSHTSGIPDYTDFPDYQKTKMISITKSGLIKTFKDKKLEFSPGEKFQYSNSNYILLGQIIETVSGKPYEQFLQEKIFTPLKMNNTGFVGNGTASKKESQGYEWTNDTFQINNPVTILNGGPSGGMFSTVEDLLIWNQSLNDENLLTRMSLDKLFTPNKGNYGYGWFIEKKFDRTWINHSGHLTGFQSQISRFPKDKVIIIALSNLENTDIGKVTDALAAIIFGEPYQLPKTYTKVAVSPELYKDYAGDYELSPNLIFTVIKENDNLVGQLRGQKEKMIPFSETEFYIKKYDLEIKFLRNAENKVQSLIWNQETTAKKIK